MSLSVIVSAGRDTLKDAVQEGLFSDYFKRLGLIKIYCRE